MTRPRQAALLGGLALALPALVLLARLPSHPIILRVLNDFAHAPVFAALAVVLSMLLRDVGRAQGPRRHALACLAAVAVGGLVELLQPYVGRGAQWGDLLNDALGAISGVALLAAWESPSAVARRWLAALALAALLPTLWPVGIATLAYAQRAARFPVLLEPGSVSDRWFLQAQRSAVAVVALPALYEGPGEAPALRVELGQGDWPGLAHAEPAPDWRGFERLRLDLTNPSAEPLRLTLRVHDRRHDHRATDRFNRVLLLPGAARRVFDIPLAEIVAAPQGRELELSAIAGLLLFASREHPAAGRHFYVSRIWLE